MLVYSIWQSDYRINVTLKNSLIGNTGKLPQTTLCHINLNKHSKTKAFLQWKHVTVSCKPKSLNFISNEYIVFAWFLWLVTTMLLVIASELYLRVQISENIHSGLLCHGKQLRVILKFKVQLSNTLSFKEVTSSFNNSLPKIWFNRLHQLWLIIHVFKYFLKIFIC